MSSVNTLSNIGSVVECCGILIDNTCTPAVWSRDSDSTGKYNAVVGSAVLLSSSFSWSGLQTASAAYYQYLALKVFVSLSNSCSPILHN